MTTHELAACDKFIYSRLSVDAPLKALTGGVVRCYSELAPEGTNPPYVTYGFIGAVDLTALGASQRVYTRPVYLIKAVTQEQTEAGVDAAIANRIEAAIVGASGQMVADGVAIGVWFRKEIVRYVEIFNGVRYNHVGARYQTFVTSL